MIWRDKLLIQKSSAAIKPQIRMKVELLKAIDGNVDLIGKTGTIVGVSHNVNVNWDVPEHTCGTYKSTHGGITYYKIWNGNFREWNNGCFKILRG